MPKARLTKSSIAGLVWQGKQTRYFDTKVTGFGVQVNQHSSTYIVQTRVKKATADCKEFVETIGRTDVIKFDDALARAKTILEDAAHGITPDDRRKQKEQLALIAAKVKVVEAQKDITLAEVTNEYLESRNAMKEATKESYRDCMEKLDDWQHLPIRAIRKDMILRRHTDIGNKYPAQADKVMRVLRAVCTYAEYAYDDVLISNPVKVLSATKKWYKVARRTGYLTAASLPKFFTALDAVSNQCSRLAMLVMLFNGARKNEVYSLKWSDINICEGTMRIRETKTGKPLEVPLCSYIRQQLTFHRELYDTGPDGYVFPSYGATGHITDIREAIKVMERHGSPHFIPHDLRRTFQTYCETLKVPIFTIKRLVGHALPADVTQGYIQFPMDMLGDTVESVAEYILRNGKRGSI